MSRSVNWLLDADIRGFFHSVDHEWPLRMWRTGRPTYGSSG
jgi:hypothetical protein